MQNCTAKTQPPRASAAAVLRAARRLFGLHSLWLAIIAAACGSDPSAPSVGRLAIRLRSSGSVQLENVTYQLTRPDGYFSTGPVAVADAEAHESFGFKIDNLPPGSDYKLLVFSEAKLLPSRAKTSCRGSSQFTIDAGQSSSVSLGLQCDGVARTGSQHGGKANECPAVLALSAAPDSAPVGGDVKLSADIIDRADGPVTLTYAWASASGSIFGSTRETSFHCRFAGATAVSLAISDGDDACADVQALVYITCTDAACLAAGNCATIRLDSAHPENNGISRGGATAPAAGEGAAGAFGGAGRSAANGGRIQVNVGVGSTSLPATAGASSVAGTQGVSGAAAAGSRAAAGAAAASGSRNAAGAGGAAGVAGRAASSGASGAVGAVAGTGGAGSGGASSSEVSGADRAAAGSGGQANAAGSGAGERSDARGAEGASRRRGERDRDRDGRSAAGRSAREADAGAQ